MHTRLVLALLCLVVGTFPMLASGEQQKEKPAKQPSYEFREDHDPDGTGKFYMGREIAQVMSHLGASWLERPTREEEEQPSKMLQALELKKGTIVADIGAGSGYHSIRMAKLVGNDGKVYAVDIQKEMLAIIKNRAKKSDITNIIPILGEVDNPKLPANEVDLVLMVDVYHEFSHPYEMTRELIKAIKPGGRLVFVEFRLEDPLVPIKLVHKMSEKQVLREMEIHPEMEHERTIGTLPWQHIIIFRKKDNQGQ